MAKKFKKGKLKKLSARIGYNKFFRLVRDTLDTTFSQNLERLRN